MSTPFGSINARQRQGLSRGCLCVCSRLLAELCSSLVGSFVSRRAGYISSISFFRNARSIEQNHSIGWSVASGLVGENPWDLGLNLAETSVPVVWWYCAV